LNDDDNDDDDNNNNFNNNNNNNNNNNITEAIPHTIGAYCALTQVDYTHRHNSVASIVNKQFTTQCGLSKKKPTP